MSGVLLAVDGGNAKTDLALVAADGTVLALVRGPGCSPHEHGVEGALDRIEALLIEAGADGALARGMQWQGLSLRMTLRHEPTPWIPSSYMPTLAGRLFYLRELAGPLEADCH